MMNPISPPPAPEQLPILSVVDQVYSVIRARIASGVLTRGSRVHQQGLAAELGVSRTPVREALRRLSAEGLVEMHTNRGARVADVDRDGMRAPFEARLVLEPGAARFAAQRGAGESIHRMRAAIARQRQVAPNVHKSFDANREFHLALVEASGNPFLLQFAERLWVARLGEPIYARSVETPSRMELDADEHAGILAAIEAGEPRRAEARTRRHIADAIKRLMEP